MLPNIDSLDLSGKKVLVRLDLDVPIENGAVVDDNRIEKAAPTLEKIKQKNPSVVILIGHRGRPKGIDEKYSLKPLLSILTNTVGEEVTLIPKQETSGIKDFVEESIGTDKRFFLLENIRFWPQEEKNDDEFAKQLAQVGNAYINESFATAHRAHASIVDLPKYLPHAAGERFSQEVAKLTEIKEKPARPLISILSGVKEDKKNYIDAFVQFCDKVLVGGRLPVYLGDDYSKPKVLVARLIQDKEDITLHAVESFEDEIEKAKSIIVSGPVGKYEEEGHRQGTKRVFEAVANSEAYKLAGGGDTEASIKLLGLEDKFDWISTGGGAMLEFLSKGTLPAIEALKN